MSKFEEALLKAAYNHYLKTHDNHFSFNMRSDDDLLPCTEALGYLFNLGYIASVSDNVFQETIDILSDLAVSFELTDLGIQFCAENLM